jgi:hypothetical protein
MHELDNEAGATRDCGRCGGRAFYWRSAIVLEDPHSRTPISARHQPAWTCMFCGYIEPHERRQQAANRSTERRHL